MNKLLFVVSDYLPNRSGGTLRVEKNIKYLKNKIHCFVFCPDLSENGKYSNIDDVEIYRTKNLDLSYIYYSVKNIFNFRSLNKLLINHNLENVKNSAKKYSRRSEKYIVPDVYIFWAIFYFFKLLHVVFSNKIDVIYSSSPASSNHLIVLFAKFFFRKKVMWVAEFRDPWITNPFRKPKNKFLEFIDMQLEKAVITKSDLIIVTSKEYKSDFTSRYGFEVSDKIFYHPNGYDCADFGFNSNKIINEKKIILSTGNYYDERSLLPFLVAFNKISTELGINLKIEFIHYGEVDLVAQQYIEKHNIEGIKIFKAINHLDCIVEMQNSDVLLLVPGPGKGTIPGKTFEYLASYKPILSIIDDETPVSNILKELKIGPIIKTNDINTIYNYLLEINNYGVSPVNNFAVDNVLIKFQRKNIALDILNNIINNLNQFRIRNA